MGFTEDRESNDYYEFRNFVILQPRTHNSEL